MVAAAVEAVVTYAGSSRDLIVSEDAGWLTRGFSSLHGIAALCSATGKPKRLLLTTIAVVIATGTCHANDLLALDITKDEMGYEPDGDD
ncbi:unnamed protein product [Rotaria magnacalcarata]|uniref:Uncharacterized protein n=1 Tax=Rotaria magnacalcarata TaxID=392030 RepID=A0A8S2QEX4_9BILA|nr:unnamed protein product [Rotaria magnacalcarata]